MTDLTRGLFWPLLALLLSGAIQAQAQGVQVRASHPDGVYAAGETIVWEVTAGGTPPTASRSAHYQVKLGGGKVLQQGDLDLSKGAAEVRYVPAQSAAYLLTITDTTDPKAPVSYGGAVVSPNRIQGSLPKPSDFDAFWQGKLKALRAVPAAPVVTPGDSGVPGVDYETVAINNIAGATVYAQIAHPTAGTRFPALIIFQWAGVYGLQKSAVTGPASQGWLAVDVMAHDLPLNKPDDFYAAAAKTLKDYAHIGHGDRETSYFLKMLLGDVRVTDYIANRPDWDGKTMVASGTSQGGFQAIALAGLESCFTAATVLVPAGCDQTASLIGRGMPWPYWLANAPPDQTDALAKTSRYYDAMNFASLVHVPTLVGIGLIDQTSTPSGDFAMVNHLAGPREVVILPLSDHHGTNHAQVAYSLRQRQWLDALKAGHRPASLSKPAKR